MHMYICTLVAMKVGEVVSVSMYLKKRKSNNEDKYRRQLCSIIVNNY